MDPEKNSRIKKVSRVAMNIVSIQDVSSCDTLHTAAGLGVIDLLPENSSPLGCNAASQDECLLKL
jgi:hypothetical protein